MADKNVREELAELTEAVRELRDREVADELRSLRAEVEKLRAGRAAYHCHGCSCTHIHWHQPYTWTIPGTVTHPIYVQASGSTTSVSQAAANVAAGGGTTYFAALGN